MAATVTAATSYTTPRDTIPSSHQTPFPYILAILTDAG